MVATYAYPRTSTFPNQSVFGLGHGFWGIAGKWQAGGILELRSEGNASCLVRVDFSFARAILGMRWALPYENVDDSYISNGKLETETLDGIEGQLPPRSTQ